MHISATKTPQLAPSLSPSRMQPRDLLSGRCAMATVSACYPDALGWYILTEVCRSRATVMVLCESKGAGGFKCVILK